MRLSTRTRHGSVSMGLGELMVWAFFLGPLYLMWWMLVGAVKLVAALCRWVAAERAARESL